MTVKNDGTSGADKATDGQSQNNAEQTGGELKPGELATAVKGLAAQVGTIAETVKSLQTDLDGKKADLAGKDKAINRLSTDNKSKSGDLDTMAARMADLEADKLHRDNQDKDKLTGIINGLSDDFKGLIPEGISLLAKLVLAEKYQALDSKAKGKKSNVDPFNTNPGVPNDVNAGTTVDDVDIFEHRHNRSGIKKATDEYQAGVRKGIGKK